MQINHIIIYKNEVSQEAWDTYCALEHAQLVSDNCLVFHTVPKQVKSEVYTFSSYSLDKQNPLLWHLEDGVQEEYIVDMSEVIEELKEHPEYMEEFLKEVDTTADNCLLLKGW